MKTGRNTLILCLLGLTVLALPAMAAQDPTPWFDLEGCAMCKHMAAEKGLMENMQWENHLTADGMMSITVVGAGYEEAFQRSMKNMKATGEKMMAGEKLSLCGFCQSYGGLHMTGANFEHIETRSGMIELITSHDPAVVAKIQKHGQRTIDEYNKMFGAAEHGSHDGHGHDHGHGGDHKH